MHSRSLLSPAQRELAVTKFEAGQGSESVASELRVPEHRVRRLYGRWRIHGRLCLVEKPTKSMYSFEVKKEVVTRFLAGEAQPALALEFRLSSPQLVRAWVTRYRAEGDDGLRPKPTGRPRKDPDAPSVPRAPLSELQKMQRENARLRAENAYLKKLRDLRDQGQR